jgi:hypothetical protein
MSISYIETGASYNTRDRNSLTRVWDSTKEKVTIIMYRPSTAGSIVDDTTIRRCCEILKRNNYGSVLVLNIHDDVSEKLREIKNTDKVVIAWGKINLKKHTDIVNSLRQNGIKLDCFGVNLNGTPKLPTYLPYETEVIPYN